MSQIQVFPDDSSLPDIETITGDTGGSVGPDAAFNVNILGGTNIEVNGNAGTNTLTINTAGGAQGTGQTVGAVDDDIITFALGAVAGTFTFNIKYAAHEAAGPAGAGGDIIATATTTGAAGALVGVPVRMIMEDAALVASDINAVVAGNDLIVRATGVAALTINWSAQLDSVSFTV